MRKRPYVQFKWIQITSSKSTPGNKLFHNFFSIVRIPLHFTLLGQYFSSVLHFHTMQSKALLLSWQIYSMPPHLHAFLIFDTALSIAPHRWTCDLMPFFFWLTHITLIHECFFSLRVNSRSSMGILYVRGGGMLKVNNYFVEATFRRACVWPSSSSVKVLLVLHKPLARNLIGHLYYDT